MGKRLTGLAAGLLLGWSLGVQAATLKVLPTDSYDILLFDGEFRPGDEHDLINLLSANDGIGEVWFNSPGGSLGVGLKIGEVIRERKLATRVPSGADCASACFYAFAGGIIRAVESGGRIGIHMASVAFNDDYVAAVKRVLTDRTILSVDDRVRFIVMLNEQFSAVAAGAQAVHLVKMGVSLRVLDRVFETLHIDIHWLSRAELTDYNVTN